MEYFTEPTKELLAQKELVFFDIETRYSASEVGGWQNTHLMGFGIAVAYSSKQQTYTAHTSPQSIRDVLLKKDTIAVSYNGTSFDFNIIGCPGDRYQHINLLDLIFKQHRFRISLAQIGEAQNNPKPKNLSADAPKLLRQGDIQTVIQHCQRDVKILKTAFYEVLQDGHVTYKRDGHVRNLPLKLLIAHTTRT